MPNVEIRMPKECRSSNSQMAVGCSNTFLDIRHLDFFRHSDFGIRVSTIKELHMTEMRRMAFDAKKQEMVCALVGYGFTRWQAALHAGVSGATLYRTVKQ